MSDECCQTAGGLIPGDHSGANHEYTINTVWMNETVILCVGHASMFKVTENYPLPTPCNCRICNP